MSTPKNNNRPKANATKNKTAPKSKPIAKKAALKVVQSTKNAAQVAQEDKIKANKKEMTLKAKKELVVAEQLEIVTNKNAQTATIIEEAVQDTNFSNYIARSVGKRARDIIKTLSVPQTDDAVAERLQLKINEVRRMLNTLNTYGVARYNVNKDSRGWLTFKWYIDSEKLSQMRGEITKGTDESIYKIPEWCNDFFICEKCYTNEKTIFPFDAAFEMQFKCDAGHSMKRVNKVDVEQLVMQQEGRVI